MHFRASLLPEQRDAAPGNYLPRKAVSWQISWQIHGTKKHQGETASWVGNSPNVVHRHYEALVKETDAKEFWEITPDKVAQIIPMPDPAAAAAAK
jgi:hypothetical protein